MLAGTGHEKLPVVCVCVCGVWPSVVVKMPRLRRCEDATSLLILLILREYHSQLRVFGVFSLRMVHISYRRLIRLSSHNSAILDEKNLISRYVPLSILLDVRMSGRSWGCQTLGLSDGEKGLRRAGDL